MAAQTSGINVFMMNSVLLVSGCNATDSSALIVRAALCFPIILSSLKQEHISVAPSVFRLAVNCRK